MDIQLDDASIDQLLQETAALYRELPDPPANCPPFPLLKRHFLMGAWDVEAATHVRACPRCLRALGVLLEYEHVRWAEIERLVADPDSCFAASAIAEHTRGCTLCSAKLLAAKLKPIPIRLEPIRGLAAAPADSEDREPTRVEVIEKEIRITIIHSGSEYVAHVDATGPVSAVTIVMRGDDTTEHELEIELEELDLVNTKYRWYGARSLGTLENVPTHDGAWMLKAFVRPQQS